MSTIGVNSTAWYTNSAPVPPQSPTLTAMASPFNMSHSDETPPPDGVDAALARTQHMMTEGAEANVPANILETAANEGYIWETIQANYQLAILAEHLLGSTGQMPDLTQSPLARYMANALQAIRPSEAATTQVAPGVPAHQY